MCNKTLLELWKCDCMEIKDTQEVNWLAPFFLLVFEETNDPNSRSFFSEIISSISDVKFSHSGRYMMTRDYLSIKIWDLNMESRPLETYQVCDCCHLKTNVICFLYCNNITCHTHTFDDIQLIICEPVYNNFIQLRTPCR